MIQDGVRNILLPRGTYLREISVPRRIVPPMHNRMTCSGPIFSLSSKEQVTLFYFNTKKYKVKLQIMFVFIDQTASDQKVGEEPCIDHLRQSLHPFRRKRSPMLPCHCRTC